ncbi:MAG TPA: winged helix-turn-helix domain-containing protein [Solirubrobacterales bacterium]
MRQGHRKDEPEAPIISAKLAKAVANPWRARILRELSTRPMSPSQFVEEVGGELTSISRCFRQLAEWGYVEVVETRRGGSRRGGVERVYANVQRAHFDTESFERLPPYLLTDMLRNWVERFLGRLGNAVETGTLQSEGATHLSWDIPTLDRQAWTELTDRLEELLESLPRLEAEAAARLAESGGEAIPATVALAAFRSPPQPGTDAKP